MRYDAVIIGGGIAGNTVATYLQKAGMRCALISFGLTIDHIDSRDFTDAGGELLKGDKAIGGDIIDGTLKDIRTLNLGDEKLEARYFVLASGKYAGMGLESDMSGIREPVFALDVEFDSDRSRWFDEDFSRKQPFLSFGVKTESHKAVKDGKTLKNLYVTGEILCGMDPTDADIREKVMSNAVLTAETILEDAGIRQEQK